MAQTAPSLHQFIPFVQQQSPAAYEQVVVGAFLYDGILYGDRDEAFALVNVGTTPINVAGWSVSDGRRSVTLPSLFLTPQREVWCARDALAFQTLFGFTPGCEYGTDADPNIPDAKGTALRFSNTGGHVRLFNASGQEKDTVVYKNASSLSTWHGTSLWPLRGFRESGQIFYRKWQEYTVSLWPDTDGPQDWAQDPIDLRHGQRVRYPGWNLLRFWVPATSVGPTNTVVAVTPDATDAPVVSWLKASSSSIDMAVYTLRSPSIAAALADAADRGVRVRVLVEGRPVGGLSSEERSLLDLLHRAGVQVYLLVPDRNTLLKRYRYMHAKYIIVDGTRLVVSTENFSPDAFPPSDWGGEVAGRRGVVIMTDALAPVQRAVDIFAHDVDTRYSDVFPYAPDDPEYGAPTHPGASPVPTLGYRATFTQSLTAVDVVTTTLLTAPENVLYTQGGLLGLIDRAGSGDTLLVMGLYEHLMWDTTAIDVLHPTNPRWLALFAAAARGARVRVLLDRYFVDPGSPQNNNIIARLVNERAQAEGWDLEVRVANPTGLGLHAKVYLLQIGDTSWTMVGSVNGSAVSHKANREMALLVASSSVHAFLSQVFWHDWQGGERP